MALCALLLLSGEARAQEVAEEGPKVQQIQAVERGLFLETSVGVGFVATTINERKYGIAAPLVGIFAGYDILEILNLSIGLQTMAVSENSNPAAPDPAPVGDIFFLMPQLRLQFAVLTTERNFLWIRAHGGFGFGLPGNIEVQEVSMPHGGNGPVFGGSVGFERFTKLRHFSIGANAGVEIVTKPGFAVAISIVPMVKYTF